MAYNQEISSMVADFLELADKSYDDPEQDPWELVNHRNDPRIEVYKYSDLDNCFKVVAQLEATAETAFDMLSDIQKRSEWDDLCVQGTVLETVNEATRIQYLKTRAIWPTASRDATVLSWVGQLKDSRYINVTRSIEYEKCKEQQGIVRMNAKIAGQLVAKTDNPKVCKVIQVADGDLKGWIPANVLSFIATQAIPLSFKKLNTLLLNSNQKSESEMIKEALKSSFQPLATSTTTPTLTTSSNRAIVKKTNLVQKINHFISKLQPYLIVWLFLRALWIDYRSRHRS